MGEHYAGTRPAAKVNVVVRNPLRILASLIILGSAPAGAQSPTVASQNSGPASPTLQQEFDTASRAAASNDCNAALAIFDRIAKDSRIKPGSLPAAAIDARRGRCLIKAGRQDDGIAAIQAALPVLRKAGADFAVDLAMAEQDLGVAAYLRWDHDAAVAHFRGSLKSLSGPDRLLGLAWLVKATMFDDGAEALDASDEAIRLLTSMPKPDRDQLANIHTLRGRTLLNKGRVPEAYSDLKKALDLSGGLTPRLTLSEAALRSDLAQAALLMGKQEEARKYLAYTGAGRMAEAPFASAVNMDLPACGQETGLGPDDVAIVEFSLRDDGEVENAQTVYSRSDFDKAATFARAVKGWVWQPEDIAKIPDFYRLLTRVEVRCSSEAGQRPGLISPLWQRLGDWAVPYLAGLSISGEAGAGRNLEQLRALTARYEAAGDKTGTAATLTIAALSDPLIRPRTMDDLDRALSLLDQTESSDEARNAIRVLRLLAAARAKTSPRSSLAGRNTRFDPQPFLALAGTPEISRDPLAQDTLLLTSTPRKPDQRERQSAKASYARVADDDRLPAHHPLRQYALLALADLSIQDGQPDAAQAYFSRTGLTEQQCSLIGMSPVRRSPGTVYSGYPQEALNMGFEGWVRLEFDIDAQGATSNVRPVIAYPPFVFVKGATQMANSVRYASSYRPSGGIACSAQNETIRFVIPSAH